MKDRRLQRQDEAMQRKANESRRREIQEAASPEAKERKIRIQLEGELLVTSGVPATVLRVFRNYVVVVALREHTPEVFSCLIRAGWKYIAFVGSSAHLFRQPKAKWKQVERNLAKTIQAATRAGRQLELERKRVRRLREALESIARSDQHTGMSLAVRARDALNEDSDG